MKIYNPAPGRPVTSPYGPRTHPITKQKGKMHHGIDYGGSFNVLAAQDGEVVHIGYSAKGGGHVVILKHASDLYTVYYHGQHKTPLKKGARVHAGDFIYRSGSTGASTGNHLHFECRKSRRWGNTFDPESIMVDGPAPKPGEGEVDKKAPSSRTPTLKVNGKLNRATWKAWQDVLKDKYGYRGLVDGIPGKLTWRAVQRSGVKHGYNSKYIDGIPGPNTRKSVQRRLKALGQYSGRIDGIWGRGTISGLQRALNRGIY